MSRRMAVHFGSLERLLCNLWHNLTGWLLTTPSNSAAISCIPRVSKSSGNKAAWNCFKRIYLHIRHFHRLGSWQGLHKVYTKPCCCSRLCRLRPPETCSNISNTPGFTKVSRLQTSNFQKPCLAHIWQVCHRRDAAVGSNSWRWTSPSRRRRHPKLWQNSSEEHAELGHAGPFPVPEMT